MGLEGLESAQEGGMGGLRNLGMGKRTLIRGHVAINRGCRSQGGDGRVTLRDQEGEGVRASGRMRQQAKGGVKRRRTKQVGLRDQGGEPGLKDQVGERRD